MGGCCCSSRKTEPIVVPAYHYLHRVTEEQVPLSPHHAGTSGASSGFLVNPDLQISNPDANPLPPPNLTVVDSGVPPAESGTRETPNTKTDFTDEDLKDIDRMDIDFEQTASVDSEAEFKKSSKLIVYVVEECPTCLEEYDEENPKIISTCGHDFHLPCIFEWMERSDTCPVCNKVMGIKEMINT